MIDLPEVREILRENGLFNDRAKRLNRRGQLPTQLRHYIKAEDSNEASDENDEGAEDRQMDALDEDDTMGLAIMGTGIKGVAKKKLIG